MTVCSSALCFNKADPTNDPAKPPFCDKCKKTKEKKHGGSKN